MRHLLEQLKHGTVFKAAMHYLGGRESDEGEPADGRTRPVREEERPDPRPTMVVLPFVALGDGDDSEQFANGFADELRRLLARSPELRVAPRTLSVALTARTPSLASTGRKLKADYLVEGSVRLCGERLRIVAQLVHADSDSQMWADTWDGSIGQIFAIEQDILEKLGAALDIEPIDGRFIDSTTGDARAWTDYLSGRSQLTRGGDQGLRLARDLFRKAVGADPGFGLGWSYLGLVEGLLAMYHDGGDEARQAAEEASSRARELAPGRAEPHVARGVAHMAFKRFAEAEQSFRQAIAIDPEQHEALYNLGRVSLHQGKDGQAVEFFLKASGIDADDYESPMLAVPLMRRAHDEDRAKAIARIGVERAERVIREQPENYRAYYLGAPTLHFLGDTYRADDWARTALAIAPEDHGTLYNVACYYAAQGRVDEALDCLERSISSRTWLEHDADLDPIRDHPRFKRYLASLD